MMVEIRPHVAVRADYAQANGLSQYVPKDDQLKPKARKPKPC